MKNYRPAFAKNSARGEPRAGFSAFVHGLLLGIWSGAAVAAPPVADPGAPSTHQSQIFAAPNGVNVVNIAAPNAAGLSHNQYQSYSVDADGLVLNNARDPAVSHLAGALLGNPLLSGQTATIILNEVTHPNRSALNGYQEIHGAAAEYVLANPYGITCNGCGFINTPRATLSTGTPNIDSAGNLTGLSIRQGDIAIEGLGLDATDQETFDLLARRIVVNAPVVGKDLGVIAGNYDFDTARRTAAPVIPAETPTAYAIDTSALGGMYANRIRLVATEAGVGVRMASELAANADDLTISSAGHIELSGRFSAARDAAVVANGNLNLAQGDFGAGRHLSFAGNFFDDRGTAEDQRVAGGNLAVASANFLSIDGANYDAADNLTLSAGATISLGNSHTTLIGARNSGRIDLAAHGIQLGNANVTSSRDIEFRAQSLNSDLGSATTAGANLSLWIAVDFTNAGSLRAAQTLQLRGLLAGADLNFANLATGVLEAKGLFSIANHDGPALPGESFNLTNAAGGALVADRFDVRASHLTNAGTVQAARGGNIVLDSLTNQGSAARLIASTAPDAVSSITVNETLSNEGVLIGTGAVDIAALFVTNTGAIHSAADLSITAVEIVNDSAGGISALGDLALHATATPSAGRVNDITNRGLLFAGGAAEIFAARSVLNLTDNAEIQAQEDLQIGRSLSDLAALPLVGPRFFRNEGRVESVLGDITIVADVIDNAIPFPTIASSSVSSFEDLNDSGVYSEANVGLCTPFEEFFGCGGHHNRHGVDFYIVLDRFPEKEFTDTRETRVTTQSFVDLSPRRPSITAANVLQLTGFDSANNIGGTLSGAKIQLTGKTDAATFTNQAIVAFRITEQRFFRERWDCPDAACVGPHGDHRFESFADHTSFVETNRGVLDAVHAGVRADAVLGSFTLVNLGSPLPPANDAAPDPEGAGISLGGLNLALPANPNGLFVRSRDPSSRFLIETNPLFTSLESPFLGSDYLALKLGLEPETLTRRLGNDAYEARLIREQLVAQTGLDLLRGASTHREQVQLLLDNAAWAAEDLSLSFGVALTAEQLNALKQDIVWMVETEVEGQKVLAPVVYLSNATRGAFKGAQLVAERMAISGESLTNVGGSIDIAGSMQVTTRGDITNTSGKIAGGSLDLASTEGSIVNQTQVTRFGTSEEFRDRAGKTGEIRASDTLTLTANEDIVNRGATLGSAGDTTLSAGRDIRSEALALSSRAITYAREGNQIQGSETTTITEETTHQRARIDVGGNLDASAERTLALVGSDTDVAGDAALAARDIDIRDVTDSRTVTTQHSSRGFTAGAGLEEGSLSQYRAGVGYATQTTNQSVTDTTVNASKLNVGGNLALTGAESITVTGSDVAAGSDLTLSTQRLVTQAAEQGRTTSTREVVTSTGVYATGGGDRAGLGARNDVTVTATESWDMQARTARLKAGNDLTRSVSGGSIRDVGTQIEAGGNVTQNAATIESLAAQNRQGSDSTVVSNQTNVETGLRYEGEQAYKTGATAFLGLNPRLQTGVTNTTTVTTTNITNIQAVTAAIKAGGNVNSTSTAATRLQGTQIEAGKDLNLAAQSLSFEAAQNTSSLTQVIDKTTGEVKGTLDLNASVGVTAGGGTEHTDTTETASNAMVGALKGGRNVNLTTTDDATLVGTNITAGNRASLDAGGNLDFQAARDTYSKTTNTASGKGELGASASLTGTSGSISASGAGSSGTATQTTSIARGGAIDAGKGVNLSAGEDNDLRLEGTNLAGGTGDVNLTAGRDINLEAAESTFASSTVSTAASAGLTLGNEVKVAGGSNKTLGVKTGVALVDNAANATLQQGGLITGNNVNLSAGRDIAAEGTGIIADETADLNAARDINYRAATSTFTSRTSEVGVGISLDLSRETPGSTAPSTTPATANSSSNAPKIEGPGAQVNVKVGTSNKQDQVGGFVLGRNVDISAGQDITAVGTQIGATDTTNMSAGRDLTLQSAQSTEVTNLTNVRVQGEFATGAYSTGAAVGLKVGVDRVNNLRNQNAVVSGANVNVTSGNDLTMQGANIAGNNVNANIGGDLTVESRADRIDETHVNVNLYAGGFVPKLPAGKSETPAPRPPGPAPMEVEAPAPTPSLGVFNPDTSRAQNAGKVKDANKKLTNAQKTLGQVAKTGVAAGFGFERKDIVDVTQQSGITGVNSTAVTVGGSTSLVGARIGSEAGGTTTFSSAGPVTQSAIAEHSHQDGADIGFSLKPGADLGGSILESAPETGVTAGDDINLRFRVGTGATKESSMFSNTVTPDTSGTVTSSIGTATDANTASNPRAIQASVNPQTLTQVLLAPVVQSGLKVSKALDSANATFGGISKVPDSTKRALLEDAGINVPADASAVTIDTLLTSTVKNSRTAALEGLTAANLTPVQRQNLMRSIGL